MIKWAKMVIVSLHLALLQVLMYFIVVCGVLRTETIAFWGDKFPNFVAMSLLMVFGGSFASSLLAMILFRLLGYKEEDKSKDKD